MEHNGKNYNREMSFEDVMGESVEPTFDDIFGPLWNLLLTIIWMLLINN